MGPTNTLEPLQIRKYPNRRYYDATHSRHVTLQEIHDLIIAGRDVVVHESRTGADITNLVLTQILLEKDQPKLDVFPSWILHEMIRSDRQAMRTFVDRAFGPLLQTMAATRHQFESFMRHAMGGGLASPMDWASQMMRPFAGGHDASDAGAAAGASHTTGEDAASPRPDPDAERPASDHDHPDPNRGRPEPDAERSGASGGRPATDTERPAPDGGRTATDGERAAADGAVPVVDTVDELRAQLQELTRRIEALTANDPNRR
ncbi:MAG: polyhydroxyalkanoate synthesis regulator DNA-binding domain-containing protein [Phycisphaerae bacterium]